MRKESGIANEKVSDTLLLCRLGGKRGTGAIPGRRLAKQLANPVAALISVPFQLNHDENIGADDSGSRWTLNIQPVIPFDLTDDLNLISRTILPVVPIDGVPTGAGSETGLGDTVLSFFVSPKKPTAGGWIWGAGPVFLLPTSTDDTLGLGEWGPV